MTHAFGLHSLFCTTYHFARMKIVLITLFKPAQYPHVSRCRNNWNRRMREGQLGAICPARPDSKLLALVKILGCFKRDSLSDASPIALRSTVGEMQYQHVTLIVGGQG